MCSEPAERGHRQFAPAKKAEGDARPEQYSHLHLGRSRGCLYSGAWMALSDLRTRSVIQPRSIHGAGGASRLKEPFQRRVEDRRRFGNAIHRRKNKRGPCAWPGFVGDVYVTAVVLIALPAPGSRKTVTLALRDRRSRRVTAAVKIGRRPEDGSVHLHRAASACS